MILTEEKNWVIFNVSEIDLIDFSEVHENSVNTLRYSSDGTKTFVKFFVDTPPVSVSAMETLEGPYTHTEILEILEGEVWGNPPYPTEEPITF